MKDLVALLAASCFFLGGVMMVIAPVLVIIGAPLKRSDWWFRSAGYMARIAACLWLIGFIGGIAAGPVEEINYTNGCN